jgi:hypothetical protein
MVFTLCPRKITSDEERRLYKKYKKKFKKTVKSEDLTQVICILFLDLMYSYFNNPKRKLRKLFLPVILANFMEQGSINSAIKEYKEEKKLYSESYTCRILRKLDNENSLEISRIFRKILFKILKHNGFKNRGFYVAIDITAKPFYGDKNLHMVKGTKRKAGTNYAIQYLTASIVEEGVRFNLLCIPISSTTLVDRKVTQMILEIEQMVSIKLFCLDRGFASRGYSRIIKSKGYSFIMPITRSKRLKDIAFQIKKQSEILEISDDEYTLSEIDYTFYEDYPIEQQETVKLLALYEKKRNKEQKEVFFFITNINRFKSEDYYLLIESYRYRFGIETNYRVDNIFSALTSSVVASIRYLLMQISLIAQDLWTLVNFLVADEGRQQPRDKFKGNYSILAVINARIRDLNFIWRPKITAVQFKRKIEKLI